MDTFSTIDFLKVHIIIYYYISGKGSYIKRYMAGKD